MAKFCCEELIALVACKDERGMRWVTLLLRHFSQVYLVVADNDCRLLSQNDIEGVILPKRLLPTQVDAVFFHSSDERLWKNCRVIAENIFEFNTSGKPVEKEGVLRILRCTSPYFDIGTHDIDDITDYLTGRKTGLPSICFPSTPLEVLPALLVLCQAYLNIHDSQEEVSNVLWWLNSLNLLEGDQLSSARVHNLRTEFEAEWQQTGGCRADKDAAKLLMEQIADGGHAINTMFQLQIPHQIVVDAYNAFLKKLNLLPDKFNVNHLKPEASIIFTFIHNSATRAVASAICEHLNLKHQFLESTDWKDEFQVSRASILIITEYELIELPKLRLNGFSGSVLVIATEPFSVLKQKYRVLRFGQGSHDTFGSPWYLSVLLTKAASLFPLEPENLKFLQNELKEYERLYNHQVEPCLKQLQRANECALVDSIEQIEDIVEQLRSALPVACHAVVAIDEQIMQIQQHFQASIATIRNSKVLDRQAVKYLQQTFEQLHNLVIFTGAN